MPGGGAPAGRFIRPARAIALLVLGLLLIPQGAPAHPPSDLVLAFDEGTRVLSVTVTHPVADPTTHYVDRVLVTAGDSPVSDTLYTIQPQSPFTYTYPLPPSVSGQVQVVAECSVSGSLARSVQVPSGQAAGSPPPGTSAPGPATTAVPTPGTPGGEPAAGTLPPGAAPATTEAAAGILPFIAALALAGWRFRR